MSLLDTIPDNGDEYERAEEQAQLHKDFGTKNNDLSHLEQASLASAFIEDVKAKVKEMRRLELDMIAKEAAFKDAEKRFTEYKAMQVVTAFTNAGIDKLQDSEGNFVMLKNNYHCNPNKNDEDRARIAAWLKKMGGDNLLKHEGRVDAEQFDKLKEAGVPFADKTEVNTNSLKAFIQDVLGYKPNSVRRCSLDDVPDCIHFIVVPEIITN